MVCVLAFDSGVDAVLEVCEAMLAARQIRAVSKICSRLDEVVDLLRKERPSLLITHSNLFVNGTEAIPTLVAASPTTRYLVLTGWGPDLSEEIIVPPFQAAHACVSILQTPFSREQFAASVDAAGNHVS